VEGRSVGVTETKKMEYGGEIELKSGKKLGPIQVAYETYGELNEDGTNAVLVCHSLTGGPHAAGYHEGDEKPGWWDGVIGPGKAIDSDKYFVISSNVLGSCKGTTGPASVNPETGEPYGTDFPLVTVSDMVKVQKLLMDHLNVKKLHAVTGGSLGGMQALRWAMDHPDMVRFCIPIATTARSSPQQIAFNEVKRTAIKSDPRWNGGNYYDGEAPKDGLALARMVGHITFLSDESMKRKFGRRINNGGDLTFDFDTSFEVESYLDYKGRDFVEEFDANSYLYITRAVDYFDLTNGGKRSIADALNGVKAKFLVVAVSSDWLYPAYQSREIASALESVGAEVKYSEISSSYGHDAFLLEYGQLKHLITGFLSKIKVSDVMHEDVPTVDKGASIEKVSQKMLDSGFTHIPIVSDGRLSGIVTAWDLSHALAKDVEDLEDIMTEGVVTAGPDEEIEKVTEKIEEYKISALPVIDGENKVIGLVTSDAISQMI